MCHSAAQQLLRPRSPRLLGASEIAEPRVQDGSQSADRFLFLFFFTLKISTYLYDWRTPGYAVAHPAFPVGPSLGHRINLPDKVITGTQKMLVHCHRKRIKQ